VSPCETVASALGYATDDDPNTTMVPELCCPLCHGVYSNRAVRPEFEAGGHEGVCCEVFKKWNESAHERA
jgi:hypothetical protein